MTAYHTLPRRLLHLPYNSQLILSLTPYNGRASPAEALFRLLQSGKFIEIFPSMQLFLFTWVDQLPSAQL